MITLRVKEVAQQKGLSQARLARLADLDQKIVRWAFNKPEVNITLNTLNSLARALHVHPCELLEYVEDPPPGLE